jgi:hypothetical protein
MAKISVEFDTAEKTMAVTMDGVAMPNVQSVMLSKAGSYYGEDQDEDKGYSCSILTMDKNKDESYKTFQQIVASDTKQGREVKKLGGVAFAGNNEFLVIDVSKKAIREKIGDYLRRFRR